MTLSQAQLFDYYQMTPKFSIPDHDKPCANRVRGGGVWEKDTVEYLSAFTGLIVHAGAYFGDFLPYVEPAWAFEPVPENYFHALETIRLNSLDTVLLPVALGDRNGVVPFKVDGGQSVISPDSDVLVPMMRLDDLISRADLIHLDIEGCEQLALNGAEKLIERCSPVLVVEREVNVPGYKAVEKIDSNTVYKRK